MTNLDILCVIIGVAFIVVGIFQLGRVTDDLNGEPLPWILVTLSGVALTLVTVYG